MGAAKSSEKLVNTLTVKGCRSTLQHTPGKKVCCSQVYVSISGDRTVIAGLEDGTIVVWISNKKEITIQNDKKVIACGISPSFIYAVLDRQNFISVWNYNGIPQSPISEHNSRILSFSITQDRSTIVSSSAESIMIWNNTTSKIISEEAITVTSVSPDGTYVVSGHGTILKVWKTIDSQLVCRFDVSKEILSCAISSDGRVACSCENFFHISTVANTDSLSKRSKGINCCDISPNGIFIVSGSFDKTLTLWTSTGEELLPFWGHTKYINSCTFSPDGTFVVSSDDETVYIWDIPIGEWLSAIGFNKQDAQTYTGIFIKNRCDTLLKLKSSLPSQQDLLTIKIPMGDIPKILQGLQLLETTHTKSSVSEHCFVDKYYPANIKWNFVNDNVRCSTVSSGEIYQFVMNNFPQERFRVVKVEIVRNDELLKGYLHKFNSIESRRSESDLFNTAFVDDGEKEMIKQKLLKLFHKDNDSVFANTLFMWHGCSGIACENICKLGFADLRRTDGGFFGSGIYVTSYCKYALEYSIKCNAKMNGNYVVILCIVTVGLTYPISPKTDYDPNCSTMSKFHFLYPNKVRNDKALMQGYDSHYICISKQSGYQAVTVDHADYDELVLKEEYQVLPIAIVYFTK